MTEQGRNLQELSDGELWHRIEELRQCIAALPAHEVPKTLHNQLNRLLLAFIARELQAVAEYLVDDLQQHSELQEQEEQQ